MNMHAALPLVIAFAVVGSPSRATPQVVSVLEQAPPRDPRLSPPRTGTGVIRGRVVDAQTGAAIARAIVRLAGLPSPNGQRPSTLTDASGAFAFTALPAGSYTLSAEKSTYLTTRFPEAGRTLRSQFRNLTLADSQALENIAIPMYHGAVITGRVLDANGDPVEFASVRAIRLTRSGTATQNMSSQGSANDIGEFRLPRLAAGTYTLVVTPRRMNGGDDPSDAQPVPTYYPGAASLDQAQPIVVERGATVAGIDVVLLEARVSVVSGVVVGPDGQPIRAGGFINARRLVQDVSWNGEMTSGGPVRPDSTFELRLAPGEYDLEGQFMPRMMNGSSRPEDQLYASARVSVGGAPLTGLVLTAGLGATVTGKFVFDGTAAPPSNLAQVRVSFNGLNGPGCRSGRSETASDGSFTIEGISGTCIARVSVNGPVGGWTPKAVMLDRKNVLDEPLTFQSGQQVRDAQVIFSDRRTELTLNVTDERGQPTREYVALVFSTDETRWTQNSRYLRTYVPPPVRSPQMSASAVISGVVGSVVGGVATGVVAPNGPAVSTSSSLMASGAVRLDMVSGLPSGEYYVVALDDLDGELARDSAFLDRIRSSAQRVTLAEGVKAEVSLRRVTLGSQ